MIAFLLLKQQKAKNNVENSVFGIVFEPILNKIRSAKNRYMIILKKSGAIKTEKSRIIQKINPETALIGEMDVFSAKNVRKSEHVF